MGHHEEWTMSKFITVALITLVVVIFAMSNMHIVSISFFVGPPVEVRLIFLLMCSFAMGVLLTLFYLMLKKIMINRRRIQQRSQQQQMKHLEIQEELLSE
jgi:uncharacterized integral membrane protein